MKKIFLSAILVKIICSVSLAGEIPSGIITALSSGNAVALSEYFGQNIELSMFEKEEIYSKTQAQIILKNFFSTNPPKSFEIIHQGGKEASKYAIGSLKTSGKTYRITMLLKTNGTVIYIHQLRIENEYAE
jgi:hypothetical protein